VKIELLFFFYTKIIDIEPDLLKLFINITGIYFYSVLTLNSW